MKHGICVPGARPARWCVEVSRSGLRAKVEVRRIVEHHEEPLAGQARPCCIAAVGARARMPRPDRRDCASGHVGDERGVHLRQLLAADDELQQQTREPAPIGRSPEGERD